MILQSNSINRGDWLLNVPLDEGHSVNDPHRAGRLIANVPLFMLLLIAIPCNDPFLLVYLQGSEYCISNLLLVRKLSKI